MNPGELEASDGLKLIRKPVHKGANSLVAGVNGFRRCIPAQTQTNGHDATGDRTAQASGARHATAETGGDAWNDFRSNIQVLGDRQQDTLSSVKTGGIE